MNQGFLRGRDLSGGSERERATAFRTEMLIAGVAIGVVLFSIAGFLFETGTGLIEGFREAAWTWIASALAGRSLVAFLLFSGLVFQLTRLGYLIRFSKRPEASEPLSDAPDADGAPSLVFLVPSYKEEPEVVRRTLLAAALQPYPVRRVVLLIDDPPVPRTREDAGNLARSRELPREINELLAAPAGRAARALDELSRRMEDGAIEPAVETRRLVSLLEEAAEWLEQLAARTPLSDHTAGFFVEEILRRPASRLRERARELAAGRPETIDLMREHRRLAQLFKVEVTSFERKRYANLSHQPNKAMNLNGYLSLMGRRFKEVAAPDGLRLEPAHDARGTLEVPGADFVVVLDADSLILPEYSARLVEFMTRPGNERVAVAQTPYASVPGAASPIERIAGATTDVQLMSHQGSTLFGAGSWVGASALVRRSALDDIAFTQEERGHTVITYIRDRTLNEDTDTTVDLIRRGWSVYNYPDRLACSATPPDFGSLLIQRRRWATGGMIILPNVVRYLFDRPSPARLWEALVRAQYILSAPLGSFGIAVLMLFPFGPGEAWSVWTLPAFAAWIFCFGRDLAHSGHRPADLPRALALNVMLLPVNLAGAVNSIGQMVTGRKIPFERTPKVEGRTAAPVLHIGAQIALATLAALQLARHAVEGDWLASGFFLLTLAASLYSLNTLIGWRAAGEDLRVGLEPRLRPMLKPLLDRLP